MNCRTRPLHAGRGGVIDQHFNGDESGAECRGAALRVHSVEVLMNCFWRTEIYYRMLFFYLYGPFVRCEGVPRPYKNAHPPRTPLGH